MLCSRGFSQLSRSQLNSSDFQQHGKCFILDIQLEQRPASIWLILRFSVSQSVYTGNVVESRQLDSHNGRLDWFHLLVGHQELDAFAHSHIGISRAEAGQSLEVSRQLSAFLLVHKRIGQKDHTRRAYTNHFDRLDLPSVDHARRIRRSIWSRA